MICCRCKKKTSDWGNGNLGSRFTPAVEELVPLCPECWKFCVFESKGTKEWQVLMQAVLR